MTLQYFKKLNTRRKRRTLLQKGIFLAERTTESFSVFLFKVEDFFVELFFVKEDDEIAGLKSYPHPEPLKSYAIKKHRLQLAR